MTASSGDNDLVADTVWWKTVCAAACNGAGRFFIETKCIWRGGDILYTGKTGTDICNNFIHACNDKYQNDHQHGNGQVHHTSYSAHGRDEKA